MIKNFSYSQLDQFTKCQRAWAFRYLERIQTPINGDLLRGDAYHKAIAHAYTNIVIYKETPSLEEILSVYSDTWDKRLNDRVIINEDEEISVPSVDFGDDNPGEMKDKGIELVRIYYSTWLPTIIPHEVEIRRTVIYENIPIIYRIDLIDWADTVYDHKVKARMFSQAELDKDLQSAFYGLVLDRDGLDFHYHTALTTKKPEIKDVVVRKTKSDIDWVGRMTVLAWRQIGTGIYVPSSAGWWCSRDFCSYWGYCRVPHDF